MALFPHDLAWLCATKEAEPKYFSTGEKTKSLQSLIYKPKLLWYKCLN